MNIAARLIRGSEELNRMKRETDMLVGMLLSMINQETQFTESHFLHQRFPLPLQPDSDHATEWQVSRDKEGRMRARCYRVGNGSVVTYTTGPQWSKDERTGSYEFIQYTHASLSAFVEEVLAKYPNIKAGLQPFLEAAGQ